ncbi:hypothetical protein [Epibacterium sp. Ofav1-8]|uniref:hypothetical protein n=1 Tax=Epibacterium sp. Ofav1-8 TaxID=2917735 RepID=UPI001EF70802|nr:hypothetical protein [Epibacterium sp. Ofav1-8]MCG7625933.1 hypothetical protein [Epibacterium sp. Ofav1-8]
MLNQSTLFLATAVWAGVFGIWSGLCAGAYFLFFWSILSGDFELICDKILPSKASS